MASVPKDVELVDLDGRPITPDDQGDAATWPAWTDNHYWEPGSGQDDAPTAEERAEFESWLAAVDDADGPPADDFDFPRRRQVSPIELAQLAAHGAI